MTPHRCFPYYTTDYEHFYQKRLFIGDENPITLGNRKWFAANEDDKY